jgi:hypothetical protein
VKSLKFEGHFAAPTFFPSDLERKKSLSHYFQTRIESKAKPFRCWSFLRFQGEVHRQIQVCRNFDLMNKTFPGLYHIKEWRKNITQYLFFTYHFSRALNCRIINKIKNSLFRLFFTAFPFTAVHKSNT